MEKDNELNRDFFKVTTRIGDCELTLEANSIENLAELRKAHEKWTEDRNKEQAT